MSDHLRLSTARKLITLNPLGELTMALVLAVLDPTEPLDPALVELVGAKSHGEASRAEQLLHEAAEAGDRASDLDELYKDLRALGAEEPEPSKRLVFKSDASPEAIKSAIGKALDELAEKPTE